MFTSFPKSEQEDVMWDASIYTNHLKGLTQYALWNTSQDALEVNGYCIVMQKPKLKSCTS